MRLCKKKMSITDSAGLFLLCLSLSIVISQADWNEPRLLKPEPQDVIWSWKYQSQRANILLQEEVEFDVCIAILNYEGSEKPEIGTLEEGKSLFILGAELRKNESTSQWSLWITKKQDYETPIMQDYRFPIIVGSPTYPTIALNIGNIDDNDPIIQANERNCQIEENFTGKSNCTYTVSDADGWIDNIKITLSTVPDDSGKKHFDFITSKVSGAREKFELDAVLNVDESLDFETISMYMLLITAIDGEGNKGNLTTVVEVVDMPDEPPVWTSLTAAEYILEKTTKNFSVSATDGDIQINAPINYRIEGEEEYFVVDPTTGIITIKPIDRDALQNEVFRFVITAYEVPEPDSKINATIIVIVEDVNDNIPTISPEVLAIEIKEETYTTLEFNPSIEIQDPDLAENGQFSVSLLDESKYNWSSAFLVVPTSGYQKGVFTISVVNSTLLDYEDENWRNIDIKLKAVEKADPSHIGIKNINIQLINWNDELPIFDPDNVLEVSVPEDVEMGYEIATVHATDRDVGDNVTHTLVSQRTMEIDSKTGVIVTTRNGSLDFESMPVVVVQVVATDLADHKTYATLTINVIDVNDVPPKLYMPKEIPSLLEEEPNNTEVQSLIIKAEDVDTDAELFFTIDWDNTKAHKNSVPVNESLYRGHLDIRTDYPDANCGKRYAEGTIFITNRIDYEASDVIFLTISVTDSKTVHNENTTSATLTLNIIDINDNKPVFKLPERMDVVENQESDSLIGTIIATDADGPMFNKVSYFIEPTSGTKDDLIYINTLNGVIRVKLNKSIDAEEYEYIYYNVIATDGELQEELPIEIYVIDQNDETPYLLSEKFNSTIHIREKSPSGTEIVQVWAQDDDRTCPFNEVSFLINLNYSASLQYFSMSRYDGWLIVNLTDDSILDRDFGDSEFTLNLKLRDNYVNDHITWNSNSFDYTVKVILDDINDQKPLLPNQTKPVEVSETTSKNNLIMTVVADDRDDPSTVNTKVFYKILSITSMDGTNLDENCKELFVVETRDESAADILTNCDLKGHYGRWEVELYAQDLGVDPEPQNHTNKYIIQVTDFNFNDPVIEFPNKNKRIPLRAEQTLHAQLITYDDQLLNDFTASDEDHGDSGTVTFSLSDTGDNQYFKVVPSGKNAAQLQLIKEPDLEEQYSYTLNLKATDGGKPARSVSQEVMVVFISSLGPKFNESNEWTVWIKENKTGLDFSIEIPAASDMVSEPGENTVDIYYFFINQEGDSKFFNLDKTTRILTVVEELDREKQEIMTLYVVATTDKNGPPRNPLKDSVLTITVVVLDVNDNPPIFELGLYPGGVAMTDAIDKVILTVKATDADLNDTLTYSQIVDSMEVSDTSLSDVSKPFSINQDTGDLLLQFIPTNNMKGSFNFEIVVRDAVDHEDTARVQISIISQSNRVVFTFNNRASHVKEEKIFIMECFDNAFKFESSIDDIKSAVGDNDQLSDNVTDVTTHFISPSDKLPINAEAIVLATSDLQTISNLKEVLLTRSLRLVAVPTGTSNLPDNTQETLHWVLVTLTIVFCLSSIGLLVAFVIRTKRLTARLDKLANTEYISQESDLDKVGAVPRTNQFKEAGSNPMWKTSEKTVDDNISQGSGDSDLIGIEDNPDFGYSNPGFRDNDVWGNVMEGSVNPVLANHGVIWGDPYDQKHETLQSSPEKDPKHISYQ